MYPLITLTSDWGTKDHYIGAVKGKLYSLISDVTLVDITHNIPPQDILQAAFIVKNACLRFPAKTIHIIDVDSVENTAQTHIVIEYADQFFIATDNGLPSEVFKDKDIRITAIEIHQDSSFFTFTALDLFAKVASMLAQGISVTEIGRPHGKLLEKRFHAFDPASNYLRCSVEYVDKYGNLFLNITEKDFHAYTQGRTFEIRIGGEITLLRLSQSYDDVPSYCPLLTISSTGNLQIALNGGNASQMFKLGIHDKVLIQLVATKVNTQTLNL